MIALGGAVAGGCDGARPVVDFTPRFGAEKQTVYAVSIVNQHDQAVLLTGGQSYSSELLCTATFTVDEVRPDGSASVSLRLSDLVYHTLPGTVQEISFDASRPDDENHPADATRVLRELLDTTIVFDLHARGAVRGVSGGDELVALMNETARGRLLGQLFTPRWFAALAEDVFLVGGESPERRQRETWEASRVITAPTYPTTTILLNYTLAGVAPERAEIEVTGSVSVDFASDTTAVDSNPRVVDQFVTQRVSWDRRRGRLAESESRQLFEAAGEWQEIDFARRYVSVRSVQRIGGSGVGGSK